MADFELGGVLRGRTGQRPARRCAVQRVPDERRIGGARSPATPIPSSPASARRWGDPIWPPTSGTPRTARGTNMAELDEPRSRRGRARSTVMRCWPCSSGTAVPGRAASSRLATCSTDPHYLARQMVLRAQSAQGWDVPMNGIVPRFVGTPGAVRHPGPTLGAHTDEVLRDVVGLERRRRDQRSPHTDERGRAPCPDCARSPRATPTTSSC